MTKDIDRRLYEHEYYSDKGKNGHLYYAIRKYGWDSFNKAECQSFC